VEGATVDDELLSSGDLSPEEHPANLALTIVALADLYPANPHVRYVAVFQNRLRPAGASFDHLD
jgi:galactose-1-phosphate uridylyltransferase